MRSVIGKVGALGVVVALTMAAAPAGAQVIHDEQVNGDLSSNRLAPTSYVLSLGSNQVLASNGGGDVDYLLKVVVADMAGYDRTYKELIGRLPALADVSALFSMERLKSATALPIPAES